MTLTTVYEAVSRPRPGRSRGYTPYTPAEDATIQAMLAAGGKYAEIAAGLGRSWESVRYRASIVATSVRSSRRPGPRPVVDTDHCPRCSILLAVAPAGDAGLCGWCTGETR